MRLGFGPQGGTEKKKKEKKEKKEKEKEKFPLCEKAEVICPFGAAAQKGEKSSIFTTF